MDSQPRSTDGAPAGAQAPLGRRTFIRRAAIGAGAVGALALVPTLLPDATSEGVTVATTTSSGEPLATGPVVVYVRDAARGEAVIMAGDTESIVTDPVLVTHLLRAQNRHLT